MKKLLFIFVGVQGFQIFFQLVFSLYYLSKLQVDIDFQSQTEERLSQHGMSHSQSFNMNNSFEKKDLEENFKYRRDIKTPRKMMID